MTPEELKASIQAAVDAAIADAYARGFEEGGQAAIKGMVEAASRAIKPTLQAAASAIAGFQEAVTPSPSNLEAADPLPPRDNPPEGRQRLPGRRAPKGLTKDVMGRVLAHGVSLRLEDIQRRAVELDPRISPKTVYNDLRRETDLYEQDALGRWKLKSADTAQQEAQQMEAPM